VYRNGDIDLIIKESPFYDKPIFSRKLGEKEVYIRQGASSVKADDNRKKSMFAGATGGGENQLVEGDPLELVETEKLEDYVSRTGLNNIDALGLVDKLRKLKAFRENKLTVFGLVAFGKDEEVDNKLNNTYIDFKYFNGKEKVGEDLDDIYKDRKEFHGDIKKQFNEAFSYLMGYIRRDWPVGGVLNAESGLREDVYVLPEEAFREALANAIAHRDYAMNSSSVNIDLYADRIEMTNPGESLVAIEDLEKTDSKARNPILMEFLKTFRVTDKSARGILTIKQAARKKGLLDPKFENISGSFKVTLYFSSPYTDNDKIWLEKNYGSLNLRDSQKNAIIFAKNNAEGVSNSEYCDMNHMNNRNDDKRARRELAQLVELGILTKTGENRGSRYVIQL
jgi:ATP-dependent DNA helicase RecG